MRLSQNQIMILDIGNVAVDDGKSYIRRVAKSLDDGSWEDTSIPSVKEIYG